MGSGRLPGELHTNKARAAPQVVVKVGFGTHQPLSEMTGKRDMLGYYFRFDGVCIQSHGRLVLQAGEVPYVFLQVTNSRCFNCAA